MYIRERRLQIVARVQMLLASCVLLLNARTQPSFDQTDDGVDAETSLSLSLSLHFYLSSPPLHFLLALTFGQYILFVNAFLRYFRSIPFTMCPPPPW